MKTTKNIFRIILAIASSRLVLELVVSNSLCILCKFIKNGFMQWEKKTFHWMKSSYSINRTLFLSWCEPEWLTLKRTLCTTIFSLNDKDQTAMHEIFWALVEKNEWGWDNDHTAGWNYCPHSHVVPKNVVLRTRSDLFEEIVTSLLSIFEPKH